MFLLPSFCRIQPFNQPKWRIVFEKMRWISKMHDTENKIGFIDLSLVALHHIKLLIFFLLWRKKVLGQFFSVCFSFQTVVSAAIRRVPKPSLKVWNDFSLIFLRKKRTKVCFYNFLIRTSGGERICFKQTRRWIPARYNLPFHKVRDFIVDEWHKKNSSFLKERIQAWVFKLRFSKRRKSNFFERENFKEAGDSKFIFFVCFIFFKFSLFLRSHEKNCYNRKRKQSYLKMIFFLLIYWRLLLYCFLWKNLKTF